MEFVIIGLLILLLIIIIGVVVYLLINNNNNSKNNFNEYDNKQNEEQLRQLTNKQTEISTLLSQLNTSMQEQSERSLKSLSGYQLEVVKNLESKLKETNEFLGQRLDLNIEKANTAYTNIAERVSKIDQTKDQMITLNKSVQTLNNVLQDRQSRGVFGEIQLYYLLENAFGNNKEVFETQFMMENRNVVDAVIKAPEPVGLIPIDSKFPLDNYRIMVDLEQEIATKKEAEKKFKLDVRKHIDDISRKYITKDTHPYAIMFIPAEAVFNEISNNHQDLVAHAHKQNVWLTSPTSLVYILSMISSMIISNEKTDNIKDILIGLERLSREFERLEERWNKYYGTVNRSIEQGKDLNITFDKITRRFKKTLSQEIIDDIEDLEEEE